MLTILPATAHNETVQARELFQEYAESLGFSLCFQGFDKELAGLPGDYAPPRGRLLLAYAKGELAGCVALHAYGGEGACEVKRLFVRPAFRGQQIGKRLMDAAIEAARETGYQRMLLDTVSGTMDRAIAMYRQYGFHEVESYRANPMAGVLYMELDLTAKPSISKPMTRP